MPSSVKRLIGWNAVGHDLELLGVANDLQARPFSKCAAPTN